MFFHRDFCERLRRARKKAGYTMIRAAEKLYIQQASISRYERGVVYPTIDRVVAMANLYGVSLDWLCGRGVEK